MKYVKQAAARIGRVLAILAVVVLVAYAGLVMPNDARMDLRLGRQEPFHQFFKLKGSLFQSGMEHHENIVPAAFDVERGKLIQALPDYVLPASARFSSPYQVYVPVGTYPLKLDAQDGLFVPNGTTLTLKPGLEGKFSLRFAVFSPQSAASLSYLVDGTSQSYTLDLAQPPTLPFDLNGQFYRGFWRFIQVDPGSKLAAWTEVSQDVTLGEGAKLQFTCKGAAFGCILGDVQFYGEQPTPPRSVLVVLVDTLRADAVNAGHAPHMEALGAESINFAHALAPGNMTSPSTNALLSCRRPSQLGELAFSYGMSGDIREKYYLKRQQSFPERFLRAGYETAMIGNISVVSEIYGVGINHGFARQISLETDGYDTPAIARDTLKWLGQHGDHGFLLYVHFNGPHAPYRAPLRDILSTFPGFGKLRSYAEILKWLYQGEVAYTDRYLDLVLRSLKDLGLENSTTVVLTADHGDQHTEHRFIGNEAGPDFTGAYFDHGATLLNDEIQVPLMIREPGASPRRIAEYVSTLDLGPTLLDMVAHVSPGNCATESFASIIHGQDPKVLERRVLGSEGFNGRAILFENRFKYIRSYEPTDKRIYESTRWTGDKTLFMVTEQLFDLELDPSEELNLAASDPERLLMARNAYRQLFSIGDSFELVIETPNEEPIEIDIGEAVRAEFEEGSGQFTALGSGTRISASGRKRHLLEIKGALSVMPKVIINGHLVDVKATSMRLPLALKPEGLPAEVGGRFTLLEPTKEAVAYLRKVEEDGQRNRHIMTGNPAFEKVLREWGYLNDK
jgi:arylsulfatase A-like enzyme